MKSLLSSVSSLEQMRRTFQAAGLFQTRWFDPKYNKMFSDAFSLLFAQENIKRRELENPQRSLWGDFGVTGGREQQKPLVFSQELVTQSLSIVPLRWLYLSLFWSNSRSTQYCGFWLRCNTPQVILTNLQESFRQVKGMKVCLSYSLCGLFELFVI